MESFTVKSRSHEELIDITGEVKQIISNHGPASGLCIVYTPHTTAAITINENADPSVKKDILKGLSHLKFESIKFSHMEGNSPSHLKSSIIGCSENIIIEDGKLILGTWQGIFFCEFDGPRTRKINVRIIPS
jgi:secondary thiamine-phosphate synthase enzyme